MALQARHLTNWPHINLFAYNNTRDIVPKTARNLATTNCTFSIDSVLTVGSNSRVNFLLSHQMTSSQASALSFFRERLIYLFASYFSAGMCEEID